MVTRISVHYMVTIVLVHYMGIIILVHYMVTSILVCLWSTFLLVLETDFGEPPCQSDNEFEDSDDEEEKKLIQIKEVQWNAYDHPTLPN